MGMTMPLTQEDDAILADNLRSPFASARGEVTAMVLIVNLVKEINETKIYLKQIEDETKILIDVLKLGEPQKSGIYVKFEQLYIHFDNILKEAKKLETPEPGYAKIDLKTGIKKVVTH
jgi:hypothetical protein